MYANGIPVQAKIDTEFMKIPRNLTVETSDTIMIAGDTPKEPYFYHVCQMYAGGWVLKKVLFA